MRFVHTIKYRRQVFVCLAGLAAFGLLGWGCWGLWQYWRATHQSDVITQVVITHSTDTPSETKPTEACEKYKAADGHPERITIPSIRVSGCITQVGIDQYGAIAVPDSIYTAAWYTKSALPGQPGLSIINGHVSGRYRQDGIFRRLEQLKDGNTFTITLGGGETLHYRVAKVQTVPVGEAAKVLLEKDPAITSQLNLITCGGRYDPAARLYDQRVIVSAELLQELL